MSVHVIQDTHLYKKHKQTNKQTNNIFFLIKKKNSEIKLMMFVSVSPKHGHKWKHAMHSAVCLVQAVIRWSDIVSKHVRSSSGLLLDKSVWFLTLAELMNAMWLIEAVSEGPPWYGDLR